MGTGRTPARPDRNQDASQDLPEGVPPDLAQLRSDGAGSQYAPLAGVRVLELGNYIAAPMAARLLADFGAEVIKIERAPDGDELRRWRLHAGSSSMLYEHVNRGKKSVALDLKVAEDREQVLALVATCDVVIENFRPGTLESWSLGPEQLRGVNPNIVITRISAFGQTGPLASRPGFAAVAEAMGGLRHLVGEPDRPPVRVGVSIGDSIAGLYAALGTVMELLHRARLPQPDPSPVIDVALTEAVLSMTESLIPDYLAHGIVRNRTGARIEGIAPSNAYTCADGSQVVIAGNSDGIFARLMLLVGRRDLAADPALRTNDGRWSRRDELDEAISAWTVTLSRPAVLLDLENAAVPAGPINTAADICSDEQLRHRNMIQFLEVDAGLGEPIDVGFCGIVPVVGERALQIRSRAPRVGEHTREVLAALADATPSSRGRPA
jgi:formyl-CoA transferase